MPRPSVTQVAVAPTSRAVLALAHVDVADAFRAPLAPGAPGDARLLAERLFADPPAWVTALMALRTLVVLPFGLKTGRPGDPVAFPVLEEGEDVVLLGLDDRHLDFRVELAVAAGTATLTTAVRFHGVAGRAYFAPVAPFHRRIVPALLARAVTPLPPVRRAASPRPRGGADAGASASR